MSTRLKSVLGIFFVATLSALLVRLFFLEDYRVASDSMYPNLLSGDLVFVNKLSYNVRFPFSSYEILRIRRPERGEVVAFTLPDRALSTYVKRIIGIEGDTIEIKSGSILVNGTSVKTESVKEKSEWMIENVEQTKYVVTKIPEKDTDYGPVEIPPNHFFVLGDNRADSVDSRNWGPIPLSYLKGKVGTVWISLASSGSVRSDRIGILTP